MLTYCRNAEVGLSQLPGLILSSSDPSTEFDLSKSPLTVSQLYDHQCELFVANSVLTGSQVWPLCWKAVNNVISGFSREAPPIELSTLLPHPRQWNIRRPWGPQPASASVKRQYCPSSQETELTSQEMEIPTFVAFLSLEQPV